MKQKIIYIVTVIVTLCIGITGTIVVTRMLDKDETKNTNNEVQNVNITGSDTLKPAIDKIYDAVYVVESYKDNTKIATGTAFVYKRDSEHGYLITNHHVIENANAVKLIDSKGQTIDGKILGSDELADLAVLSINADKVLAVAIIGDSTATNLGDTLFTVGSPLGVEYAGTVTRGTLSGKDRSVDVELPSGGNLMMEVIQTDAAINPGNSGGPLVTVKGEVIGVISLKLVRDSIEGMGFAIPIETAMAYVDRLEAGEAIQRPYLGVSLIDVTNTSLLYQNDIELDETITEGAVIASVENNSVAAKAGLKKGDIILQFDGTKIKDLAHLRFTLYKYGIGDKIKIKYSRDKKISEVEVTLNKALE